MGQGGSTEFKHLFSSTVSELSQVQLAEIGSRFNELYKQSGSTRGRVIDREAFSNFFNLPIALGDRLFEAFDKKQNGSVDFEEFVCGLSLVLHGSFSDKCQLLFEIFNVSGDEGVSREELYTLLSAVVNSTSTILLTVAEGGVTTPTLEDRPFVSSGVTTSVIDTNQAITK
jgi:Ca2+-binding EF-hand superfamily protein